MGFLHLHLEITVISNQHLSTLVRKIVDNKHCQNTFLNKHLQSLSYLKLDKRLKYRCLDLTFEHHITKWHCKLNTLWSAFWLLIIVRYTNTLTYLLSYMHTAFSSLSTLHSLPQARQSLLQLTFLWSIPILTYHHHHHPQSRIANEGCCVTPPQWPWQTALLHRFPRVF